MKFINRLHSMISSKKAKTNIIGIAIISIVLTIISFVDKDFFVGSIFIIIGVCFWIISTNSKFKNSLKVLSVFTVLHFVCFPLLYIQLIRSDKTSLSIDDYILQNEKGIALSTVKDKYDTEELKSNIKIIADILTDSVLNDHTFSYFLNGNIALSKKYNIHGSCKRSEKGVCWFHLFICDSAGKQLTHFDRNIKNSNRESLITDFLLQLRKQDSTLLVDFDTNVNEINDDNFWHYHSILWYSVNIFNFNSNIIPKNKLSNAITFIHYLFVFVFLLGGFYSVNVDSKKESAS